MSKSDLLVGYKGKQINDSGYVYAPYIPIMGGGFKIISERIYSVHGIDEHYPSRAVFILKSGSFMLWYDYEAHRAWNHCHPIKSKRKLQAYRSLCKRHIEKCVADYKDWVIEELSSIPIWGQKTLISKPIAKRYGKSKGVSSGYYSILGK